MPNIESWQLRQSDLLLIGSRQPLAYDVPALRARVEAPGEAPGVRAAAFDSLGKIGDPSARDAVLAATNDTDPRIRTAALGALTYHLIRAESPTPSAEAPVRE